MTSFVIADDTSAATHTLTLTSSGSQSINVSASSGTAISSDSINVATTCRYGYNFTLSTSVGNNNLYLNGDISNNTSGTYFSPADGSTALNTATNTWGYYYNSNASTTPTSTSVFSPVPTLSSPATIKTPLTTPASSNINDNFKIYYGVNSAPSMSVGTYKMIPDTNNSNNDGTIVYTATMAENCIAYTVHFSPSGYFEGNLITGGGTMTDQTIYEGMTTPLANVTFNNPATIEGIDYYFAGWNTAQDGSGTSYYNSEHVTDLAATGNSITLYAMWTDCPANNICYSSNASNPNDVEGSMGDETISNSATSATLYAPNYKHSNYGFAAWNTKADGTGTNYGPNQTIEFTAGQYSTGGLKLYAKWIVSAGNMQGWTGCSSMNEGDVIALKDLRDNDVYAVAKLADGKCWMIENLRLDSEDSRDSSQAQGYGGLFMGLAESEDVNFKYPSPENSLYKSDQSGDVYGVNGATKSDIYSDQAAGCQYPRYNRNNTNIGGTNASGESLIPSPTDNTDTAQWYGYGNYYTWNAAIANTVHYMYSGYELDTSICQKSWHLPRPNDYRNLSVALGGLNDTMGSSTTPTGTEMSSTLRSFPNNFIYAGMYYNNSAQFRGQRGKYLTSSTNNSSSYLPYHLYLSSSYVRPGVSPVMMYENFETLGMSVRCVIEP